MKTMNSRFAYAMALALAGAFLLPSVSFAAGWAGKYVTLQPTKSITRANKKLSRYKVNMEAFNQAFQTQSANFKRANSVEVKLPNGQSLMAPTHVFEKMVVVPYSDGVTSQDARGIQRSGSSEINKVIRPGEVTFAVKNHRNDNTTLRMSGNVDKEAIKFQDTHAQFEVGVKRKEANRTVRDAITFNNPQRYPGGEAGAGRFGGPTYNSIVFRPKYPAYLLGKKTDGRPARRANSRYLMRAFNDNIRTMLLGFNAVTKFPGDYNGGDPLSAFSPEKAKEATRHMINAIAGTGEAKAAAERYFANEDNQVYCAELGFVSASAALHVPLNRKGVVEGLGVSAETWTAFKTAIKKHNKGETTNFTSLNGNEKVAHVKAAISPRALKPMWAYAPEDKRVAESKKMAFKSMTSADMVAEFMRLHVGRKALGEQAGAAIEGALLAGMKPALMEMAKLDQLPANSPQVQAFNQLFASIHETVATPHANYDAFRAALRPKMAAARAATGPQEGGRVGEGLFAPPHLYHMMAKGFGKGEALLEMEYGWHEVHWSQMEQKSNR